MFTQMHSFFSRKIFHRLNFFLKIGNSPVLPYTAKLCSGLIRHSGGGTTWQENWQLLAWHFCTHGNFLSARLPGWGLRPEICMHLFVVLAGPHRRPAKMLGIQWEVLPGLITCLHFWRYTSIPVWIVVNYLNAHLFCWMHGLHPIFPSLLGARIA